MSKSVLQSAILCVKCQSITVSGGGGAGYSAVRQSDLAHIAFKSDCVSHMEPNVCEHTSTPHWRHLDVSSTPSNYMYRCTMLPFMHRNEFLLANIMSGLVHIPLQASNNVPWLLPLCDATISDCFGFSCCNPSYACQVPLCLCQPCCIGCQVVIHGPTHKYKLLWVVPLF